MNDDALSVFKFLSQLGFCVHPASATAGFLEGVRIEKGCVLAIDLAHPHSLGNLLHEAGHLAVIPSLFRAEISGDVDESLATLADAYMENASLFLAEPTHFLQENPLVRGLLQAGDQEAMAWSYAAALAAGVDPGIVFSEDYQEGLSGVLFGLRMNAHPGIHGLAAGGMTTQKLYPRMTRWLQV